MPNTQLVTNTVTTVTETEYAVGIHREGKQLLVRKSLNVAGVFVPVDQEYQLNLEAAIITMQQWIDKLHTEKFQERWN